MIKVIVALIAVLLATTPYALSAQKADEPLRCTIGETTPERTKLVHCPGFDIEASTWPKAWEDFTSKGETVLIKLVDEQPVPVAAPCRDRIRKRWFKSANSGPVSIDSITPADCLDIDSKIREAYTKE